jgi:hypothetical protein
MRIAIVGAGPAGLLFARLAKCRRPDADIPVSIWRGLGSDPLEPRCSKLRPSVTIGDANIAAPATGKPQRRAS